MLAPVSQTSQISSTNSELRAANIEAGKNSTTVVANVPAIASPILPSSLSGAALEQLKTLIVSSGNVEQDVLAKLADLIAKTLKIERQPGEKQDAFYTRLAVTIEKLKPEQRLITEMRTGLKALSINLADFGRALLDPAGPQAARMIAQAEVATMKLDRAPQEAITNSYLDDGAGPHRSLETLQAKMAAQSSADGQNFFASEFSTDEAPTLVDAKQLQSVLQQAYDDMADGSTMGPAAVSLPQIADDLVAVALADLPEMPDLPEIEAKIQAGVGAFQTEQLTFPGKPELRLEPLKAISQTLGNLAMILAQTEIAGATKPADAPLVANHVDNPVKTEQGDRQSKAPSSALSGFASPHETKTAAVTPHPHLDERPAVLERKPTMMLLRGLTEVVTQLADRAAESIKAFVEQLPEAKPFPEKLVNGSLPHAPAGLIVPDLADPEHTRIRPNNASFETSGLQHSARPLPGRETAEESSAPKQPESDQPSMPLRSSEPENREMVRQAFKEPLQVPYAYVPYPIEDEPEKPARQKSRSRHNDDDGDDQDPGNQQERGERAPQHPNDEVLDDMPEDELPALGRNATDADRAFRHYQRMSGF